MKKIGKKILKGLGWILVAVLVFVAGVSIYNRIKTFDEIEILKSRGYYNPVDVGDHSLNVYIAGNEEGEHTFVTICGWGDGEEFIGWRPMTSTFEEDNEFIFIDRAGYGLSDDVSEDMTIPEVVEDYRTALLNLGEEGPYILLAHSLGSLYTAYWESTYPDEIEGVIIMDGTIPIDEETQAREYNFSFWTKVYIEAEMDWLYFAGKTGVYRLLPSVYDNVFCRLGEEDRELALSIVNRTMVTHHAINEMHQFATGALAVWTWHHIVTNDIPKIYIAASTYEEALVYAEMLGNTEVYDLPGDHVIFLDRTEDCVAIIEEFMNSLDSGRT
ncbi:MAG: alpha/beta hydrolase [Saccharofermentans sp.]|nr:alpha/beta hydrolase [Saccharofermentans sp.]